MTHRHELKGENVGGKRCAGWRGIKGEKWDNCNSIINKVYLKKRKKKPNSDQVSIFNCQFIRYTEDRNMFKLHFRAAINKMQTVGNLSAGLLKLCDGPVYFSFSFPLISNPSQT